MSSEVLADISVTPLRNMSVRMLRKQKLFRFERMIWKNNNKEDLHVNSRGEAITSNVAQWKSCPTYFVL